MTKIFLPLILFFLTACGSYKLRKLEGSFSHPLSCIYHDNFFYISNNKTSLKGETRGWISKIDRQNKKVYNHWISDIRSPRGMAINEDNLYFVDDNSLLVASLKTGKIVDKIEVTGAKYLSDVAVDKDGNAYASDTRGHRIYFWDRQQREIRIFVRNLDEAPTGLALDNGYLYLATWGRNVRSNWTTGQIGQILKIHLESRRLTYVTRSPLGHLSGLARGPKGTWITTAKREHRVFVVDEESGKVSSLFEKNNWLVSPGDINLNLSDRFLCIPMTAINQAQVIKIEFFSK